MTKKIPQRTTSQSKNRQPSNKTSRKLVVIQEQKVFDNELIPQAQIN